MRVFLNVLRWWCMFVMTVSGGEEVQVAPLSTESLLLHKDRLLLDDNCHSAHDFYPHSASSSQELSSFHVALVSILRSERYSACASCYLCHFLLHKGEMESHTAAYIYAIRALTRYPKLSPALGCISALYYYQDNILRAGFYADLSHRLNPFSNVINYDGVGNQDHLHMHLAKEGKAIVRKHQLSTCVDFFRNDEEMHFVTSIFEFLQDNDTTLLEAYFNHLYLLPRSMVGPRITSYEAFLDHIEGAERRCIQHREYSSLRHAPHVYPEYSPSVTWPTDKTIVIFNYAQIDNVRKTFGENNMGLSDALNKLGVPNRMLSRSIPEDDFITILNIGKVIDEEHGHFVFWNFEKNPSIQINMTGGRDAKFDNCGNDIMRYSLAYISEAKGIWESVMLNLVKWPDNISNSYVPALVPYQTILVSKIINQFVAKSGATSSKNLLNDLDDMRPIDVLFFGSSNPHRDRVFERFRQMSYERNLNVKFYMDYDFFGAEKDFAIQQSKIVLNLANFRWPYSIYDRPNRSAIPSSNENAAEPCASATNWHRIRSLLSHGKVVLSERSGSTLEEALLSDFVTFADTDDLTSVALALLSNQSHRVRIEKDAIDYMLQDHSQCCVQHRLGERPSSLALLARAVTDLGARMWPSAGAPTSVPLTTMAMKPTVNHLQELTARQLSLLEQLETASSAQRDNVAIRAQAALGWAEIQCLLSNTELDPEGLYKPDLEGGLVGFTSNASSPCHQRSNLPLLIGYLSRRYNNAGTVLMIGFSHEEINGTLQLLQWRDENNVQAIASEINGSFNEEMKRNAVMNAVRVNSDESVDFIIVNQRRLGFGFQSLQEVMLACVSILTPGTGILILNHMLSPRYDMLDPNPGIGRNDAWKILADIRQHSNFDSALTRFDDGLMICISRPNPFQVSAKYFLERSESLLLQFLDRIVPILTLPEVHTWLSNSSGTKLYVRRFKKYS